jgi:hypothetical protein
MTYAYMIPLSWGSTNIYLRQVLVMLSNYIMLYALNSLVFPGKGVDGRSLLVYLVISIYIVLFHLHISIYISLGTTRLFIFSHPSLGILLFVNPNNHYIPQVSYLHLTFNYVVVHLLQFVYVTASNHNHFSSDDRWPMQATTSKSSRDYCRPDHRARL